jgi:hypothetical protein
VRRTDDDLGRILSALAVLGLLLLGFTALDWFSPASVATTPRVPLVVASPSPSPATDWPPSALASGLSGWYDWWSFDWWTKPLQTVGTVAAAVFAASELRRIRLEITRRSDLRLGFSDCEMRDGLVVREPAQETTVEAVFLPGDPLSRTIKLTVYARNVGTLSAHDLLWNFSFGTGVSIDERLGEGWKRLRWADGRPRIALAEPFMHPQDWRWFDLVIRVSRGVTSFSCTVEVSYRDSPGVVAPLTVHIADPSRR